MVKNSNDQSFSISASNKAIHKMVNEIILQQSICF